MTTQEKLDRAAEIVSHAAGTSLMIAVGLFVLWVTFLADSLDVSDRVGRFVCAVIVFVEALFLLFCVVALFYLKVYAPLWSVP